jgi:broad specificity phosphatase PhoE
VSSGAVRWWWVRHAPTGARGAVGWTDVPADMGDSARLDALAARLPLAPLVASDLDRARTTAARLAGSRPRLPDERDLREIHFGAWEGLDFDTIAQRWPTENARWWAEPGPAQAPGGESFDDLQSRVSAAVTRLHATVGGGDIVAVAHMGTILAALALATGMNARQVLGFRIDPLSVTRLDWLPEAGAWRVGAVNAPHGP